MKRGWMDMPGALNMPDAGTEQKTRVILVEDEGFFREMLRVSLTQSGRVEVVGDFADGEAALAAAPDLQPRAAVLDIELRGGMHGIQVGRLLRRRLPDLGIVLLSNHRPPRTFAHIPEAEIAGWSYLLKPSVGDVASLVRAIEGAAAGFVVLDPQLVQHTQPRPESSLARLTERQREILGLMAQGFNNVAIARRLDISSKTVENQVNAIYDQLTVGRSNTGVMPRVKAVLTYLRETREG